MKMIKPISITDSMLVSSVATSSIQAYAPDGNYAKDEQVLHEHFIYQSLIDDNQGNLPPENITTFIFGTEAVWKLIGAENRWKMFDSKSRASTVAIETIIIEITPGRLFNAIAILNVQAKTVLVTIIDPKEGEVYSNDVAMADLTDITTPYDWFFEPLITKDNQVLLDIPTYINATIKVEITGVGTIEVGELVVGTQREIGSLEYGYSVAIVDYSLTNRDEDGNLIINKKSFTEEVRYPLKIPSANVYSIKKLLSEYRAQGLVFVGDREAQESIVYGFIRDFDVTVKGHLHATCSLEIEEMN